MKLRQFGAILIILVLLVSVFTACKKDSQNQEVTDPNVYAFEEEDEDIEDMSYDIQPQEDNLDSSGASNQNEAATNASNTNGQAAQPADNQSTADNQNTGTNNSSSSGESEPEDDIIISANSKVANEKTGEWGYSTKG